MLFSKRTYAAVAVVVGFALIAPGLAFANDKRVTDPRDVRGALDIAAVSHGHAGGSVVHTLQTYNSFPSKLLQDHNFVAFGFDMDKDAKVDRLVLVLWNRGALRGALLDASGEAIDLVRVARPDQRTVKVSLPTRMLGNPAAYRWFAATAFQSKQACRKTCTDTTPNRALIEHLLFRLETLSVNVAGYGRVTSSPGGIECRTTCAAKYKHGETVTLTAVPGTDQVFTGWSGACTGTGACNVKLDAAASVTATFVATYLLTVVANGPGYVKINPPDVPCGGGPPCTRRYNSGTPVTLTAETGASYRFDGWNGACTGTAPVCTVTMDGDKAATANFSIRSFTLSVSLNVGPGASGRVTSSPPGIDCPGDCSESYTNETFVTLTAVPGPGSVFSGWDSVWCRGPVTTCVLGMGAVFPEDRSVSAAFGAPG